MKSQRFLELSANVQFTGESCSVTNCSGHRASHYVCLTWSAQKLTCKQWTVLKGCPELLKKIKSVLQLNAQTAPRFTDSRPTRSNRQAGTRLVRLKPHQTRDSAASTRPFEQELESPVS